MKRALLGLLIAVAVLAPAHAAFAAESTATPNNAPRVEPELIDVQFWTEDVGNRTTLIVVGVIPTSTPLPATIALPIPKGAQVTWAGEIFTDAAKDISLRPSIMPDGLSLLMTATKSHTLQYEAQYDPYVDQGGRRHAKLAWVQNTPSAEQRFSVKLPLASDDIKLTPPAVREPFVNDKGEKLFNLPAQKLKTGGKFDVSADYIVRLPETPRPKSAVDYVIPITLGLLAVAVVALVVLFARSSRRSSGDREGRDDNEPFSE